MRRKLSVLCCVLLCALLCACGAAPQEQIPAPADSTLTSSTAAPTTPTPSTAAQTTTAAAPTTLPPEPASATPTTAPTTVPTTIQTTKAASTTAGSTAPPQTTTTATTHAAVTTTKPAATTKPTTAAPKTTAATTVKPTTTPSTQPPQTLSCSISIDCKTLLSHLDELDDAKRALVPQSGVLLATRTVSFQEGETVFDVLKRTCRQNGIQMEFTMTPVYGSAYIEGIGNLYEFDGGPLSGWMYSVNGTYPNVGCSSCALHNGDVIVWRYTCDLGGDIGGRNQYQ